MAYKSIKSRKHLIFVSEKPCVICSRPDVQSAHIRFAGAGIGIVFGSLINSVARNPSLTKQLFGYAILGFALTEAIALFALMMSFLILFVF